MKWFIMTAVVSLLCAGCLTAASIKRQEENLKKLEEAKVALVSLQKEYDELKESFLSGRLDVDTFTRKGVKLTEDIATMVKAVEDVSADVKKQNDEGTGWPEIIAATVIGMLSRGLPSKGPLGMLVNRLAPWRRKE